jgi:hypothetical protein
MQYYAINEVELKQFHMAGLVAGGGDAVLPVVNGIRERKISYAAESQKPAHNTGSPKLLEEMEHFAVECDNAGNPRDAREVRSWVKQLRAGA